MAENAASRYAWAGGGEGRAKRYQVPESVHGCTTHHRSEYLSHGSVNARRLFRRCTIGDMPCKTMPNRRIGAYLLTMADKQHRAVWMSALQPLKAGIVRE